jgi:outer membrane protein assembly factor BamB
MSLTRLREPLIGTALIVLLAYSASASDWPAYRQDARRSAVSTDRLDFSMSLVWHRKSSHPPRPAFADPLSHPTGVDFAYIRDHSEPVLLDFDHAFHPVSAGGRVFFSSSADDAVRCLSLATGKQEWVFVTGGPVRFAPQVMGDRLFVASDDGFVYCLSVTSGEVIWQFQAAPSPRQLVGNGRMISSWPLRTGVLVLDGTVYVTAGMWPAEGIFIYAIDANTGTVKWVNDTSGTINEPTKNAGAYTIAGVAPTGYLLAGHDALVVPTGRSIPASYSLEDGRLLKAVAPSYQNRRGGPAVCIDPHGSLIFGYPRERLTGTTYSVHYAYRLPTMQPFGSIRADRLVVDDRAFVAVNDLIRCYTYDARYRKVTVPWQADCPSKTIRCMSLAANALLMGIDDSLVARDRATGDVLWKKDDLDGYVQSVAVVDGQLLVATDSGSLYCFATGGRLSNSETTPVLTPQPTVPRLADGWRNALEHGRIHRGLALVIGQTDTALAAQIAAATQLQVVLLLDDTDAVMEARRSLLQSWNPDRGQVSVQREIRDKPLPFADYAFNLIAATGAVAAHRAAELRRVLRPSGGILYIDEASAGIATQVEVALQRASESDRSVSTSRANEEAPSEETADARPQVHPTGKTEDETRRVGNTLICRRGKLPGALDWDSETKTDQRVKWPLELLWFGGPGSKRTGSGSRAPVAAGGRNLVIGKNHLIALDAYNGTELWSRTIPYLYRNIGRLKNAPGPIKPWLTQSISSDDERTYLNFGHVVYTLDAATGEQQAVHGELPVAPEFSLKERPQFVLDHYQKPDIRGTVGTATKSPTAAGTIQLLALRDEALTVTLRLDAATEVTDKLYWELFFDVRPPAKRDNLYERGLFQLLVKPATGRVEVGLGPAHPKLSVVNKKKGRHVVITIPYAELSKLGGVKLGEFCFAAALNHQPSADQKSLAGGRGYLRWEFHADAFAYAFNNGWPRIIVADKSNRQPIQLPAISELPNHAVRSGRIGRVGRRAGYVVNVGRERQNPLSLEVDGFEYNRGKGCGNPVACGSLHVLRSGTLAFYDLNDDSGMRYFGGVRPSCTVSAVPAQGVVFAAEGSSGCSCNYNFKTTLALSPARHRRHEDWAMFMAPLSPGALLRTGRFNLGAPGDRRDDSGGLWLQYPRAPTYPNRSMPVPVELIGQSLKPFRVNADRVPIANTDRPWLYASGFEGIEGIRLRLFMSDKEGIVVFHDKSPVLDAVIEETAWEKRFAVPAGIGSTMYLSHDHKALYVGYEVVPPIDRRGVRQPWQAKGSLPHAARFALSEEAEDTAVWQEDSLEFLISDTSLKTILHFGVGVTTGRYDGLWSSARKTEEAAYAARWAGAIEVTEERAVAEIALPWKTLTDAGLDLENLVIRPRMKQPLVRQPHISHGFRPILVQANQPQAKRYQVALHFAELGDVAVGERVFDIQIQGKTVLEGFDPVAVAGGSRRAVVQVFRGIRADRALDIHFLSHPDSSTNAHSPMLSALEVLLDK